MWRTTAGRISGDREREEPTDPFMDLPSPVSPRTAVECGEVPIAYRIMTRQTIETPCPPFPQAI